MCHSAEINNFHQFPNVFELLRANVCWLLYCSQQPFFCSFVIRHLPFPSPFVGRQAWRRRFIFIRTHTHEESSRLKDFFSFSHFYFPNTESLVWHWRNRPWKKNVVKVWTRSMLTGWIVRRKKLLFWPVWVGTTFRWILLNIITRENNDTLVCRRYSNEMDEKFSGVENAVSIFLINSGTYQSFWRSFQFSWVKTQEFVVGAFRFHLTTNT